MAYFKTAERVASTLNYSTYIEAGGYLKMDPRLEGEEMLRFPAYLLVRHKRLFTGAGL